ncbi:NAD-dependent epimerase/dehydratase family protein [Nitrosopumilus adriaticus]|uniref:Nucleoside-diphosphate-sugar epimerase n=1 Tax=Nitrosopumilus adriaticus TaxID=1580092 RepID=A0A0D5C4V5_9ARCH|nr:GDP-mannose 4,6-dehydratase [Nitrosopumilus adriaticus]AJW71819.1 Nucleoside-diphosphate-sugar epimerase [Nitrosopumilus adriaticus]
MEEILITGTTGFIGNHLVSALNKNYKIFGISKNKIKSSKNFYSHNLDITKSNIILKNHFSKIIHMAAYSDVNYCNLNPTKCYELNVNSTLKMLEIARKKDSSFIFLSSSHVYGNPKKLPIAEIDPCHPFTHYASSKKMSEILCETYSKTYDLDIRVARIFSVYGPSSSKSNLVFNIINQMIHDSKVKLGNVSPKRDFIFIDDVINGLIQIINSKKRGFQVYNLGSGKSISIEELVKTCFNIHNKNPKLISSKEKRRKNEISDICANISKMKSDFNWKPKISLKKGLEITYNSYI